MRSRTFASFVAAASLCLIGGVSALSAAPNYHQTVLTSIYPAGGQRGETVKVTLTGWEGGLRGADSVVIDGPPGITVQDVKPAGKESIEATFVIAAGAVPGRRMVRAKGGVAGLTNFRWFFVGPLPEHVEKEKNNTPETAEQVEAPLVVNGRVGRTLDRDCYRFRARAGQKIVAAVLSHGLDAMGYERQTYGFSDTSLELLDEQGRVVAEAGDTIGFDPLIHHTIEQDGWYTARVSGMGFRGFSEMVYRLTLGEVPYPTAIFPVGGRRGETVEIEFFGPNVPPGTTRTVAIPADDPFPVQYVSLGGQFAGLHELPLLRGDDAELSQTEPSDDRTKARPIPCPAGISGRFGAPGEQDWYRISLKRNDGVLLSIAAQRHLRAPVDTLLQVFDASGKLLAENDDGAAWQGECTHDFIPFDSRLFFRTKQAGDYFVCVSEQSGASGPRAVYRLKAEPAIPAFEPVVPDFRLFQWPDAVPVWGPGTTSAFVVEIHRFPEMKSDVEISVEGLPEGWTGSKTTFTLDGYRAPRGAFGHKAFLTITAPEDAPVGTMAEFHVVGRARIEGREIVRRAQPLTLYLWQEPNRFRFSPISRAVVAPPHGPRLEATARELTATPGSTLELPIRIDRAGPAKSGKPGEQVTLSVNRAQAHYRCAVGGQIRIDAESGEAVVPVSIPPNAEPGVWSIVVADGWSSETRKGLPGPCTRLISVRVVPRGEQE